MARKEEKMIPEHVGALSPVEKSDKLDQLTMEIMDLKTDIVSNFVKIGERLNKIKEEKLYLDKHFYFEQYLEKEVKFSKASAYRYMKLSRVIGQQPINVLSLRKWDMIIPLDEEHRQRVIEYVKEHKQESDLDFRKAIEQNKWPKKEEKETWANKVDEKDLDFSDFWKTEKIALNALEKIQENRPVLVDLTHYMEKISRSKEWEFYKEKNKILGLHQQVIREVGLLK